MRYRTCWVAARFLKGRVVRAVWVQLERPDRRGGTSEERLLLCTDPDLAATEVITSYAKRWSIEPLFAAMKHGWGLKDAWQQSRVKAGSTAYRRGGAKPYQSAEA